MSRIAFLGLGAMGSRMAARLVEAGHAVTVWNRTPERTQPLVDAGARAAETPRRAAQGAEVVFSMVRDDEASRTVWLDAETGALGGMEPGATGIECSTLSVGHVRDLARAFEAAGYAFLDVPLAGSRPQAEAGQLIFLAGGDGEALAAVSPLLDRMGAAVHHAGGHGAGAAVKLMVNALFGAQLAVMGELIGFARAQGIDAQRAVEIIGSTPVCSPAARLSAGAMLAGAFAPAFPIDLVAKDFGLLEASADTVAARLPVCAATGQVYRDGVADGIGGRNITGIMQLYVAA